MWDSTLKNLPWADVTFFHPTALVAEASDDSTYRCSMVVWLGSAEMHPEIVGWNEVWKFIRLDFVGLSQDLDETIGLYCSTYIAVSSTFSLYLSPKP